MRELAAAPVRSGAVALGVSAVLLAVFPLVRPFFPLDPRAPAATLALASPAITSGPWVLSHLIAMLAFVLLIFGLMTLHGRLADSLQEPPLRALVGSIAGIALIMPMLGVETHILPIVGGLYLSGATDIAPGLGSIYRGSAMAVFLLGLLLLAAGAIGFARVVWRTRILPRWAGVLFAAGLALWFPPFPRAIRVADGFLIGIGGAWLAWSLWREGRA